MISRVLHRQECVLPTNIAKIDFRVKEMKKVKVKQIGSKDKFVQLRRMVGITAVDREKDLWVVGGIESSSSVKKNSLNFYAKSWWTLIRYILSPILAKML